MHDDSEHSNFEQKLIDAVKNFRCLYDKKHKFYFNRRERENSWRQIGEELGRTAVDCHKRWKLLREKLAKELKKRDKCIENGEIFLSEWICFESIMFVEDHIAPRRKVDRLPLALVKDLSKKRTVIDNNSDFYAPLEKRSYSSNDFNFFAQLSKQSKQFSDESTSEKKDLNVTVKGEPTDEYSNETEEEKKVQNVYTSNEQTSSLISETSNIATDCLPGTLDLTKTVDTFLKDLSHNKETSLNFIQNLTNALKIKDFGVFKNENLTVDELRNETSSIDSELEIDEDINEDENSVSTARHNKHLNSLIKRTERLREFKLFNEDCESKSATITTKEPLDLVSRARIEDKDNLFGKLVTSMLADITDEEFKDDAKFSVMQILIHAKRACNLKKIPS